MSIAEAERDVKSAVEAMLACAKIALKCLPQLGDVEARLWTALLADGEILVIEADGGGAPMNSEAEYQWRCQPKRKRATTERHHRRKRRREHPKARLPISAHEYSKRAVAQFRELLQFLKGRVLKRNAPRQLLAECISVRELTLGRARLVSNRWPGFAQHFYEPQQPISEPQPASALLGHLPVERINQSAADQHLHDRIDHLE